MNEQKNFLEVLKEELEAMQESGLISEEQLEKGLTVPFGSLYFKELDWNFLSLTMANILKQENPEYVNSGKTSGYNPHIISEFTIKKSGENIEICILGRDRKTTVSVTNEKSDSKASSQITPEEFLQKYCQTKNKEQLFQISKKFFLTRETMDMLKGLISSPKDDAIYIRGLNTSFNEMMKNFTEYCKYYLEEIPEKKLGPKQIKGGIIEQEVEKIGPRTPDEFISDPSGGKTRKSEIYSFDERCKILSELDPKMIISFDTIDKDGKVMPGIYHTFIYKNPQDRGGYLLISEPYQGDKASRASYVSDEQLKNFLIDGQQESDEVWIDIARYYVESSFSSFIKEPFTYQFKHFSIEGWSKAIEGILSNDLQYNSSNRSSHAAFALYTNEKIRRGEFMEAFKRALQSGKLSENDINRMSSRLKNSLGLSEYPSEKIKGEKL